MQNIALGGALVITLGTQPVDYVIDIINILGQSFKAVQAIPLPKTSRHMVHVACHGYGGSEGVRRAHIARISEVLRVLEDRTGQHISMEQARTCYVHRLHFACRSWRGQFLPLYRSITRHDGGR